MTRPSFSRHRRRAPLRTHSVSATRLTALVGGALGLLAGVLPAAASAGSYTVLACNAAGANHSWIARQSPLMSTGSVCPTVDDRSGLKSRSSTLHVRAGSGSYAEWRFTAPAGTTIVGLSWVGRMSASQGWESTIETDTGHLLAGCRPARDGPCRQLYGGRGRPAFVRVPAAGSIRAVSACRRRSGCLTGDGHGNPFVSNELYSTAVAISQSGPPQLAAGGPLWAPAWLRGPQAVTFSAHDTTGIQRTSLFVDGALTQLTNVPCDFSRPAPCHDVSSSYTLDTGRLSDGPHTASVTVANAAGNPAGAQRTIYVDNTPPDRPQAVAVAGGEGWRATNGFNVTWQNPGGQASPITTAHYRLCHSSAPDQCVEGAQSAAGISSLTGLQVPGTGDYVLEVWLEDQAANQDVHNVSDPVHLRFDDQPPRLAFRPDDPNDPRRVSVAVSEPDSGLAAGEIQLSREGTNDWRDVPTTVAGNGLSGQIDDTRLAPGRYLLRAFARDGAGNVGEGDQTLAGRPAQIEAPLRVAMQLRAGFALQRVVRFGHHHRRARHQVVLRQALRVGQGARALIGGRLTNTDGQPLRGARIAVFSSAMSIGSHVELAGVTWTDARGGFSYVARATESRSLQLVYDGSAILGPAGRDLVLSVPAPSTLRVSPHFVLNGGTVVFRGGLLGRPRPPAGKLVSLQAFVRGQWRTFADTRTDRGGRFSYRYRFDGTRGTVTYSFRALVPREPTYPFATGVSGTQRVTVRGL